MPDVNPSTLTAQQKLTALKGWDDFVQLLRFLDENHLCLLSRRAARTSGQRRGTMFSRHFNPNKVHYLYDDGWTSGTSLITNLSRVFTVAEGALGEEYSESDGLIED